MEVRTLHQRLRKGRDYSKKSTRINYPVTQTTDTHTHTHQHVTDTAEHNTHLHHTSKLPSSSRDLAHIFIDQKKIIFLMQLHLENVFKNTQNPAESEEKCVLRRVLHEELINRTVLTESVETRRAPPSGT